MLQNYTMQGRNERGQEGSNSTGAQSLWGRRITAGVAENLNSITSAFFNTVHLLPKDLRFEHGGAKLASAPGAIQLRFGLAALAAYLKPVFGFASFLNRASVIRFPLQSYFHYCFSFQSCHQAL